MLIHIYLRSTLRREQSETVIKWQGGGGGGGRRGPGREKDKKIQLKSLWIGLKDFDSWAANRRANAEEREVCLITSALRNEEAQWIPEGNGGPCEHKLQGSHQKSFHEVGWGRGTAQMINDIPTRLTDSIQQLTEKHKLLYQGSAHFFCEGLENKLGSADHAGSGTKVNINNNL